MVELNNVTGKVLTFSIISLILFTTTIIFHGVWNDYVLYEATETLETLNLQGLISDNMTNSTVNVASAFYDLTSFFDIWWLASYVMFVITTFVIAYYSKRIGYFNFTMNLFYGSMIFLFVLGIMTTFTQWWKIEILYKLLPGIEASMPYFSYYLENVGIISFLNFILCMLLNLIDLDFAGFKTRKIKEQVESSEVV